MTFPNRRVWTRCFLIARLTWRFFLMTKLIFYFSWEFSNSRILPTFLHNCRVLKNWYFSIAGFELGFLAIIAQGFFLYQLWFIKILLDFHEDLPEKFIYICNALGLMTCMHPYLIWNISLSSLKYRPPSLMLHPYMVPLFAIQTFLVLWFNNSFEFAIYQSSTRI